MKTAGIVCEYNPLHLGHVKQYGLIRQALGEDTCILCLMSGAYVQRGEPAVFDAGTRARAAVLSGANLVLELPITAALSSAEGFAAGAVRVLTELGGVDYLCFGSESGDGNKIMSTAELLLSSAFSDALQKGLADGDSFAALRQRTLEALGGDGSLLCNPNDILAVEYCKALRSSGSPISPMAILRGGSYHASVPTAENPSAASLRARMQGGDWLSYVPPQARALFSNAPLHRLIYGERAMLARLRAMDESEFAALPYGSEGLWRKLMANSYRAPTLETLIDGVKSRRYARSRIARMVLCAYLGIRAEDLESPAPYVRILAFDAIGRHFLRAISEKSNIPLLHPGESDGSTYGKLEARALRLYSLFLPPDEAPVLPEHERVFCKPETVKTENK